MWSVKPKARRSGRRAYVRGWQVDSRVMDMRTGLRFRDPGRHLTGLCGRDGGLDGALGAPGS